MQSEAPIVSSSSRGLTIIRLWLVIHVTFQKRTRDMTALYRTTLSDEPPIVWLDVIGTNQFVSCNFKSPISRDSTKRNLREAPCEGVWTDDSNRHWHFHMVVHSKPIAVKLTSPATYHGVVRCCCVPTLISIRRPCIQSLKNTRILWLVASYGRNAGLIGAPEMGGQF